MRSTSLRTSINAPGAEGDSAGALSWLAALQLADSAFPAGLYAFSHGLETAVQEERVCDAAGLERFLEHWLAWQVGPGDAVVVAASHRAASAGSVSELLEIDSFAASTKLAREARESSVKTGARLLATVTLLAPGHLPLQSFHAAVRAGQTPGTYGSAFGVSTAALAVPVHTAVLAELHGAASSLLGAALRLMRLDHQQTQTILRRQAPRLANIAAEALCADWRALRPSAPLAEIQQMRHEAAYVRLFSS